MKKHSAILVAFLLVFAAAASTAQTENARRALEEDAQVRVPTVPGAPTQAPAPSIPQGNGQVAAASGTVVSQKQDVAVFALGYHGYDIPLETLASVDAEIQSVFVNLGRFNILGQTERMSASDIQQFIDIIRRAKESNTPLPEEIRFGDVQLTEAVLNKLYGSFVVVIPTVVSYNSEYNRAKNEWVTDISTSFSFLNVAEGITIGQATIQTQGTSKETQYKSIQGALGGIAMQLTFEIRKIPQFQINTQILEVKLGSVRMQLGQNMGVKVGDEYAIIEKRDIAGFQDELETGLVVVREVGSQVSTATILYGSGGLSAGGQLREIPRLGSDASAYYRNLTYFSPIAGKTNASVLGLRVALSRGFYALRPIVVTEAVLDFDMLVPLSASAGFEFQVYMRRLCLFATGSAGVASNAILQLLEDLFSGTDSEDFITHYGAQGSVGVSYLVTRDVRIFAELAAEYWLGILDSLGGPFSSFGGYGFSVGATLKM